MKNPYEYPEHCPECGCGEYQVEDRGICREPEEHTLCGRHQEEARGAAAERRWEQETGR